MFLFIGFRRTLTSLLKFLRRGIWLVTGHKPVANAEPDGPSDGESNRPPERMRSLRSRFRMPESRGFWVTASTAVVVIEVILVVVLWDWLTDNESGSATIRNIGLVIAGSVALPLAIWRALVADRQASAAQQQAGSAQRSMLNERYQRGAEMLGSEVLSVRMGGIYTLQRLSEKYRNSYHVQVMRLFCAFVRNPTKTTRLSSMLRAMRKRTNRHCARMSKTQCKR